jgi:hypothetical protein
MLTLFVVIFLAVELLYGVGQAVVSSFPAPSPYFTVMIRTTPARRVAWFVMFCASSPRPARQQ